MKSGMIPVCLSRPKKAQLNKILLAEDFKNDIISIIYDNKRN